MTDLGIRDLKQLLAAQMPGILHELVPGLRRSGRGWVGPNPTRASDSIGSFHVNEHGGFVEYDEDVKGDLIDLIAYVNGHSPKTTEGRAFAAAWAKNRLGLSHAAPQQVERAKAIASEKRRLNEQREARRADFIRRRVAEIVAAAQPVDAGERSHPVTAYLAARGLPLADLARPAAPPRYHPKLEHWTAGGTYPAMVLPVIGAGGAPAGVHATFLRQDDSDLTWRKRTFGEGHNSKLMLGTVKGGFVPVSMGPSGLTLKQLADAGRAETLVLAEGYETALAVALALGDQRVWACLSLGNIASAPVQHPAIDGVVICLENDIKKQALKMREQVLDVLRDRCANVMTMTPPEGAGDFAEILEPA